MRKRRERTGRSCVHYGSDALEQRRMNVNYLRAVLSILHSDRNISGV